MIDSKSYATHEEWLKARKTTIGGSDAAAIMGCNPYMSTSDLWKIKTGRKQAYDISSKPYVLYGTQAEEPLRQLFILDFSEYHVEYKPNNMWTNSKYPFAHASLDGVITDKGGKQGVLEIKTTTIMQASQRLKWRKRIPDNYYIQLLHYLIVTDFTFAILKAKIKNGYSDTAEIKHYYIDRSEVRDDIGALIDAESEFWKHVQSDTEPPDRLPEI